MNYLIDIYLKLNNNIVFKSIIKAIMNKKELLNRENIQEKGKLKKYISSTLICLLIQGIGGNVNNSFGNAIEKKTDIGIEVGIKNSSSIINNLAWIKDGQLFSITNNNIIVIDSNGLIFYGNGENNENLFNVYKMSLSEYLEYKKLPLKKNVYIYRNGIKMQAALKDGKYYIKGKKATIFFGDIISLEDINFDEKIINLDNIEKNIGLFKINNIENFNGGIKIKATILGGKIIELIIQYGQIYYIDINGNINNNFSIFEKEATLAKKFRETFDHFDGENKFDEPINEPEGVQEDGVLRVKWLHAFKNGKKTFTHRGIKYNVYNNGKPVIYQVCIDFMLDFIEYFFGTRYKNGKKVGELDFDKIIGVNERRSVMTVIGTIKENPKMKEMFELIEIPTSSQYGFSDGELLEKYMTEELSNQVFPGDWLIIRGLLSDGKIHTHSVMVSKVEANGNIKVYENPKKPIENDLIKTLSRGPLRKIISIVKNKYHEKIK